MASNKFDVKGDVAIGGTYADTYDAPADGMIIEGNVGIGISNPSSTRLYSDAGSDSRFGATIRGDNGASAKGLKVLAGNGSVGGGNAAFVIKDYTDATTNVMVLNDGKTGIGTGAPAAMLDVWGDAVFNENGDDHDFRVEGSGAPNAFFVQGSDGKVGVGTNVPKLTFHVEGAIASRHASDPAVYLSTDLTSGSETGFNMSYNTAADSFGIAGYDPAGTPKKWLTIKRATANYGNVGINDESPDAQLDVVSYNAGNPVLRLEHASGTLTADYLQIATNGGTGGDIVVVDKDGKVGIGTSIPDHVLDIIGPAGTSSVDDAPDVLNVTGGDGHDDSSASANPATGSDGASATIATGAGGDANVTASTGVATGGHAGSFKISTGKGGLAHRTPAGGTSTGGNSADIEFTAGNGGAAQVGSSMGITDGGNAGNITITAGNGGGGNGSSGTGGTAGTITITAGDGGTGPTTGQHGGDVKINPGDKAAGGGGSPHDGYVLLAEDSTKHLVGIGTTSPATKLHVEADYAGVVAQFVNSKTDSDVANGIYVETNKDSANNVALRVSTTGGGANTLRVQGNGRIGIGDGTPDTKLEIADSTDTQLRLSYAAGSKYADFKVDTSHDLTIDPSDTGQVKVPSDVTIGSSENAVATLTVDRDGSSDGEYTPASFYASKGESTGALLHVNITKNATASNRRVELQCVDGSSTARYLCLNPDGSRVGIGTTSVTRTLFVNGDAGGTGAWNNDSDKRLKKNIRNISQALEKVKKLKGVQFEWKDTKNHAKGKQIGIIAQDAKRVVPEVVSKPGEYYGIQYGPLVALLIEALKEQQIQIKALEKQFVQKKQKKSTK